MKTRGNFLWTKQDDGEGSRVKEEEERRAGKLPYKYTCELMAFLSMTRVVQAQCLVEVPRRLFSWGGPTGTG